MVSQSHTLDISYISWEKSWRDTLSWEPGIRAESPSDYRLELLDRPLSAKRLP